MANTSSQKGHLWKLANAFQELAGTVKSDNPHIKARQLAQACLLFQMSNFNFGFAFIFADIELISKVNYVQKAARENESIQALVERDIAQGSAKRTTSPSRNLIRLKRVIEMVGVIFEEILKNKGSDSLVDPITTAYDQVFSPYHGSTIKEAFAGVRELIPTRSSVLRLLNENGTYIYSSNYMLDYLVVVVVVSDLVG
ncbi:hypothetical protein L484_022254 [Morus notabilis]|uniref:Glycolipid transfer protein domain-containing protein n=1 Tax=Morus notabilis TaxID=981085 RepID=W9S656_9ROSA|nr:hypothetical protein L484_022254 [Morus notabilis]